MYEIIAMDTPKVSIRYTCNIISIETLAYEIDETTTDTIKMDTTFDVLDSSNSILGGLRFAFSSFPLYKTHYVERGADLNNPERPSDHTSLDLDAREVHYQWRGVGTVVNEYYAAGIGLARRNSVSSSLGAGGESQDALVEKSIRNVDK